MCMLVHVQACTHKHSPKHRLNTKQKHKSCVAVAALSSEWELLNLWIWDTVELCLGGFFCPKCLLNICWLQDNFWSVEVCREKISQHGQQREEELMLNTR